VRNSRIYRWAARQFARGPFWLILVFNLLPVVPLDVARLVAASTRYPLRPFILANFIGRLLRYGLIALITYELGGGGKYMVLGLLGLAAVVALAKLAAGAIKKSVATNRS
jgi:uncharacterized membrane protein YdjX (TVP38/TMEM64 family)